MFDSEADKWLVKQTKEYFLEFKKEPTLEALKISIEDIQDDILKTSVVSNLKDVYNYREADDLDFVQKKMIEFCKNQSLKNAILKSVDLLQIGEYDKIKTVIDTAMKAGTLSDLGHDYIKELLSRFEESTRDTIKTPWDVINDVMDGGLGKGELGVVVAPAGIGKTWFLQSIGADAVKRGKSVVHYTLELNQAYVGLRYDTIFTGIPTANLKYSMSDVEKVINKLTGNLLIKYFPTRTASVQTLSAHLKNLELHDKMPDVVVVDYADILRDTSGIKDYRLQLGNIYEDLRGLAGEYDIPIWTASQANRSSLEEDVIEADKVAESYSKVMTADFIMSVSRKATDKIANTGRVHIMKNRFGQDGTTYPANINTNVGKLEVFEGDSWQGKEQTDKMNSDEMLTGFLKNKYDDFKTTEKNLDGFE
jgi:replicative DNA helicase